MQALRPSCGSSECSLRAERDGYQLQPGSGRKPHDAIHLAMATTTRPSTKPASPAQSGSGLSRIKESSPAEEELPRVRSDVVLTFDDVLLTPRHSLIHPKDVSTNSFFTRGIPLNVPFSSAAMDTVTESDM